ncbi:Sterile alpha motif domain-containing protein 13 [Frankliniella fusca]|uniref:Sterile alpha motif domain-containing protein 13 n=1 Tax=Frankliniella fusca TaxID=407009 RepID=A0AAE1HZZ5_9NEOP|nr:Sterile alpha motif domain-containing protein 13 [Frankliniella fusca]
MSVIKNRDCILEAIDQLRRRKARPDRERICTYVGRKVGVDTRSLIADLERLVDEQVVIKVEYKGNISYRNAAKWSKLSVHKSRIEVELSDLNKLESMQDESERMSYVLRCAISELVYRDPDYLVHGVPVFELEQHLKTKDSEFFSRISFNVLLSREAKAGTVVKLENGNYLLGPRGARASGSWSGSGSGISASEAEMSNDDLDDSALFDDADGADGSPVKSPPRAPHQPLPPLPPLVPAPALLRQMQQSEGDGDGDVAMNGDHATPATPRSQSPDPEQDIEMVEEDTEQAPGPELEPEPDPEPQPDPDPAPEPDPEPDPDPAMNHKEQEESTGYRLGERRKRAKKKVFDPSDNNLPKAKRRGRQAPILEKVVKAPIATQQPPASGHSSPSNGANGLTVNRTSNAITYNRSSNVPSVQRTPTASSAQRTPNGSAHRSSNGTTPHDSTSKDVKPSVASGNKLNAIGTGAVAVCAICISAIVDGKAIQCKDCTQKGKSHFSCLIRGNRARFRPNSWQCMMCKSCQICSMTEEVGTIVVCTNCDEGYHVKCHIPKPKIPWKKWVCCRCSPEPKQTTPEKVASTVSSKTAAYNELTVSSILKTLPQLLQPKIEEIEIDDSKVDETIPDASDWSTEDVYEFFSTKYPDYASVFKDQDIDGRSLLLMTRADVVNGLNLKLGPALKIYGQVKKLQLRRSSSHFLWE